MLIAKRNNIGGIVLPYDSEVEYVSTDKTLQQYIDLIDTNLRPVSRRFEIDFEYISYSNESPYVSNWSNGNGLNTGARNQKISVYRGAWYCSSVTAEIGLKYNIKLSHSYIGRFFSDNTSFLEVNGTLLDANNSWTDYCANVSTKLSCRANISDFCSIKIYGFKIYDIGLNFEEKLLIDMIPVRVGMDGFLYDRARPMSGVNKNGLFGNSGTVGNLGIGPDKVSNGGGVNV